MSEVHLFSVCQPVLPPHPRRPWECWQKEGTARVACSSPVFPISHTHTAHTRLHTPVKAECLKCLELLWQNTTFLWSWKPLTLPWLRVQPSSTGTAKISNSLALLCLLETYYHGTEPTCKRAESENRLTKHVPLKAWLRAFWTLIDTHLVKVVTRPFSGVTWGESHSMRMFCVHT